MMNSELERRIQTWTLDASIGQEIEDTYRLVRGLAEKLFCKYEPQVGPRPDFPTRFAQWISNLTSEEDQKTLLRMLAYLVFIGREEFETLYRVAFNNPLATWLIEQIDLRFDDPNAKSKLDAASQTTWICPISDSMRINAFYHVNRISGFDYRPDWRSMAQFGSSAAIEHYIADNKIARLVLIEDFVGSGNQMAEAVEYAARLNGGTLPVLVLPLIICPDGDKKGRELQTTLRNVTVRPVIRLSSTDFVTPDPQPKEPPIFTAIRSLANSTYAQVCGDNVPTTGKPYSPFGYEKTGALVVTYSNCPDNTLPLVHHESALWAPLFPRATRV